VLRGRPALDPGARDALASALADAVWEVLPLRSTESQVAAITRGSHVSVTASPSKTLEATVELAARLQALGYHAIPHLSARMVRDAAQLRALIARIGDAGIDEAFVVGGDAEEPGPFPDGLSLLRAMAELGHGLREVGIPCYPDGHAFIPPHVLDEALRAKAPFATYMTTQLCFDIGRIERWLSAKRADGLVLPVVLGVPGSVEPHRLLSIGARIGVRDTRRFVLKNLGLVGRLLRGGGFYRPDGLVVDMAPLIADPEARVAGLHLYTFNQVEATAAWRSAFLAGLEAPTEAA
jgi:methylenetetrahydrofolate reductase (NADPH)